VHYPSPVEQLLAELARALRATSRRARRRILAEARDHLLAATHDAVAAGADPLQAEHDAVASFGASPTLGTELAHLHRRRGPHAGRVAAVTFLVALVAAGAAGPLDHDGLVRPEAAAAGPMLPTPAQCVTAFNAPANASSQAAARASHADRAAVSVLVSLKPSTGRIVERRCLVQLAVGAGFAGSWSHGRAVFTMVPGRARLAASRSANARVAADGHLVYVGPSLDQRVKTAARVALAVDVAPAEPSIGLPVTLTTSAGHHLLVTGPLPSGRTWRVNLAVTGSSRVGRFAFPLAGRYRLAVAGRVPVVVHVQGRALAVRHEGAPRYRSSSASVLPAGLAPGTPSRVWSVAVGGGGERFVWFQSRGAQVCSVQYVTRPEGWAPLETVSTACDPSGKQASSALQVATTQAGRGQTFLVALVTTAAAAG
jgi:hypothetical protein